MSKLGVSGKRLGGLRKVLGKGLGKGLGKDAGEGRGVSLGNGPGRSREARRRKNNNCQGTFLGQNPRGEGGRRSRRMARGRGRRRRRRTRGRNKAWGRRREWEGKGQERVLRIGPGEGAEGGRRCARVLGQSPARSSPMIPLHQPPPPPPSTLTSPLPSCHVMK